MRRSSPRFYYLLMLLSGIVAVAHGIDGNSLACGVWTMVALFCDWRGDRLAGVDR